MPAGRPSSGTPPVAIAYQHVGELPQPPSVWNERVGGDLDAVTLHALEKDREVRYQDATAFRVDLENVRLGRPISAGALATGAAIGAAATQTLPPSYAVAGTPTAVQPALMGTDLRRGRGRAAGSGKRTALIAVLALLVLGLIGWGAATWFGNQTTEVVNVSVPRITGMDEETALSTLRTANLQGQKSTAASTTVPEGDVISQDPAAGTQVAESSTIRFVVSRGPDNGAVPDVTGFDKNDAQKALEDAGFKVSDFVEENSPDQTKDKVTKTDPPANSQLAQGSSIKVFYATGNVQVPEGLVGRDWAVAASTLNDAGVNPVREDVESDKTPGTVLEVAREGAVVKAGSDIAVKVAKAKATPIPTVTVTKTETAPPPTTTEPAPTTTGATAPRRPTEPPGSGHSTAGQSSGHFLHPPAQPSPEAAPDVENWALDVGWRVECSVAAASGSDGGGDERAEALGACHGVGVAAHREEVGEHAVAALGQHALGVELHPVQRQVAVPHGHDEPGVGVTGGHQLVGQRRRVDGERVVAGRRERVGQARRAHPCRRGARGRSCRAAARARGRRWRRRRHRAPGGRGRRRTSASRAGRTPR